VQDVAAEAAEFPEAQFYQRRFGHRTSVATPLLREGVPIGTILIRRLEVRPFTERQIWLLETFADQAVIAIENARLFSELEQRNNQLQESNRQVTEALEQQTVTAEVLRVIASTPTDQDRVLDAIASAAGRLTASENAMVQHVSGDLLIPVGRYGQSAEAARHGQERLHDTPISLGTMSGRTLLERRTIHVPDVRAAVEADFPDSRLPHLRMGQRSQVTTPLLREGHPIGVLVAGRA
jgi:GAF domain-containing protein